MAVEFPKWIKSTPCDTKSNTTHEHGKHGATKVVTQTKVAMEKK